MGPLWDLPNDSSALAPARFIPAGTPPFSVLKGQWTPLQGSGPACPASWFTLALPGYRLATACGSTGSGLAVACTFPSGGLSSASSPSSNTSSAAPGFPCLDSSVTAGPPTAAWHWTAPSLALAVESPAVAFPSCSPPPSYSPLPVRPPFSSSFPPSVPQYVSSSRVWSPLVPSSHLPVAPEAAFPCLLGFPWAPRCPPSFGVPSPCLFLPGPFVPSVSAPRPFVPPMFTPGPFVPPIGVPPVSPGLCCIPRL